MSRLLWSLVGWGVAEGAAWREVTGELELPAFWPRRYYEAAGLSSGLRVLMEVLAEEDERPSRAAHGEVELGYVSLHGFLTETEQDPPGISHLLEHLTVHSMPRRGESLFSTDERYTSYLKKLKLTEISSSSGGGIYDFIRGILDVDISDTSKILTCIEEIEHEWKMTQGSHRSVSLSREIITNVYRGRAVRDRDGNRESFLGSSFDLSGLHMALQRYKRRVLRPERGALVISLRESAMASVQEELLRQLVSISDFLATNVLSDEVVAPVADGADVVVDAVDVVVGEEEWIGERIWTTMVITMLEEWPENGLHLDFQLPHAEKLGDRRYSLVADIFSHSGPDSLEESLNGVTKISIRAPRVGERTFSVSLKMKKEVASSTVINNFFQYINKWRRGEYVYPAEGFVSNVNNEVLNRWEDTSDDASVLARNWIKYGMSKAVVGSQLVRNVVADEVAEMFEIFREENMNVREFISESLTEVIDFLRGKYFVKNPHFGIPYKITLREPITTGSSASAQSVFRHIPIQRYPGFLDMRFELAAAELSQAVPVPRSKQRILQLRGQSSTVREIESDVSGLVQKWRVEMLYTTDTLKTEREVLFLLVRCVEAALARRLHHAGLRGVTHGAINEGELGIFWAEGASLSAVNVVLQEYATAVATANQLCLGDIVGERNWLAQVQSEISELTGPAAVTDALRSVGNFHPMQTVQNTAKLVDTADFTAALARSADARPYLRLNAVGPSLGTSDAGAELTRLKEAVQLRLGGAATWGDAIPVPVMPQAGAMQVMRMARTQAAGLGLRFVAGTPAEAAARILEALLLPRSRNLDRKEYTGLRRSTSYSVAVAPNGTHVRQGTLEVVNVLPKADECGEKVEKTVRAKLNEFVETEPFDKAFEEVHARVYNGVYREVRTIPSKLREYILRNMRLSDDLNPANELEKLGRAVTNLQSENFVEAMKQVLQDHKVMVRVLTHITRPVAKRSRISPEQSAFSDPPPDGPPRGSTPARSAPAGFAGTGSSGGARSSGGVRSSGGTLPDLPTLDLSRTDDDMSPYSRLPELFRRKRTARCLNAEFEEE